MACKIFLVSAVILEFLFVPLFLKAARPQPNKKSLALKMVCSTLFVCAGLLAVKILGGTSEYAKLLMTGLLLGWLGDFFLHTVNKTILFLIGLISFLGGHVCYICAFGRAVIDRFPDAKFFTPAETGAFVLLCGLAVCCAVLKKLRFGAALVPIALYTAVLALMLVKAASLGLRMVYASLPHSTAACLLLTAGALLFAVSDALLAVIMFGGQKNNRKMKTFNIVAYYAAQMLLACTVIYI